MKSIDNAHDNHVCSVMISEDSKYIFSGSTD